MIPPLLDLWGLNMLDLFGDTMATPDETATKSSKLINASHGFLDWWQAWPSNTRKGAKQQCINKWARNECANEASHILMHTEFMKLQDCWLKNKGEFICAPLVYLNQQRWTEWVPELIKPKKIDVLAELKAHKGSKPSAEVLAAIAKIKAGVHA